MTKLKKIQLEPIPEGFNRVDGKSVEDVLGILQSKGIDKILCYSNAHAWNKDFRSHVIILTTFDYDMLKGEGHFEFKVVPGALSRTGLYAEARYKPLDYSTLRDVVIQDGCVIEQTQLRPCGGLISPKDSEFLAVNQLRLHEAWRKIG